MRIARLVATGMVAVVTCGCGEGRGVAGPAAPALQASPARQVQASGSFVANVDFSTLTLTPRGRNCLITVNGQLVFSGTIEGPATGQTTALVFAPCEAVATSPPGTYPDVFHSELRFDGTVDGEPAQADLRYMGRSYEAGRIEGRLVFSNGVAGRLDVDARIAVGGEYEGRLVVN